MLTVQKRAEADAIDAKMPESDRKRFVRAPGYNALAACMAALDLVPCSPERAEMKLH